MLAIFVLIAKIQLTTVTIYVSYKIDLLQTEIVNDTATTDAHGRVNGIGSQTVCWQVVYTLLKNQLTKVMIHVSYRIDLLQTAIANNITDAHGQSAGNLCTSLAIE